MVGRVVLAWDLDEYTKAFGWELNRELEDGLQDRNLNS